MRSRRKKKRRVETWPKNSLLAKALIFSLRDSMASWTRQKGGPLGKEILPGAGHTLGSPGNRFLPPGLELNPQKDSLGFVAIHLPFVPLPEKEDTQERIDSKRVSHDLGPLDLAQKPRAEAERH